MKRFLAYGALLSLWISCAGRCGPMQSEAEGRSVRDLNRNGQVDPYEDRRVPLASRVEDLLKRMTLEEKVGLMFCPILGMQPDGSLVEDQAYYSQAGTTEAVVNKHMNHVGTFLPMPPEAIATWNNNLQRLAESTRLGIPVTIYSDPRHGIDKPYTVNNACVPGISHWPDALGLAATRDMKLIRQFGTIAAQEYRAVGITVALHPMADLATEPRWGRIAGTFGEDAELAAQCVRAYIAGVQGDTWGPNSVACVTKHFPGGGPQKDGWDCHYPYGKEHAYPGDNLDYHLVPFKAAIEAGTAQIMPYHGIPVGRTREAVGCGFNREIVADLLRKKLHFDGVIVSDGGTISAYISNGQTLAEAKCWGVESLSVKERFAKAIDAGLDQFLVECNPEIVVELVKEGALPQSRIDESARRILRDKFRLGLFDQAHVDPAAAKTTCGKAEFQRAADLAQRKSIVLLKNGHAEDTRILPLGPDTTMFVVNVNAGVAARYGKVTQNIENADVVVVRLGTPYERRTGPLETLMHQGALNFAGSELRRIRQLMEAKPTIVCVYIERAAVLTEIAPDAAAIVATFGSEDGAVLDVLFGKFKPVGRLPIELPRSMQAVENQKEDMPRDSLNPLYEFGFGLTYPD